jgi:hypothetical protein
MAEKMKALWKGEYREEPDGSTQPVEFLQGAPARSLTQDEFDALPEELREDMRKSPLYEVRTEKEMSGTPAAKSASKE